MQSKKKDTKYYSRLIQSHENYSFVWGSWTQEREPLDVFHSIDLNTLNPNTFFVYSLSFQMISFCVTVFTFVFGWIESNVEEVISMDQFYFDFFFLNRVKKKNIYDSYFVLDSTEYRYKTTRGNIL